jgi:hypothetical protein
LWPTHDSLQEVMSVWVGDGIGYPHLWIHVQRPD